MQHSTKSRNPLRKRPSQLTHGSTRSQSTLKTKSKSVAKSTKVHPTISTTTPVSTLLRPFASKRPLQRSQTLHQSSINPVGFLGLIIVPSAPGIPAMYNSLPVSDAGFTVPSHGPPSVLTHIFNVFHGDRSNGG